MNIHSITENPNTPWQKRKCTNLERPQTNGGTWSDWWMGHGTWLWGRKNVWKCAREDNDRTNTSKMSLILVFRRVVLRSPSKRLPSLGVPFTRTVTSNEGLTVADLERRIAQLDRRIRAIEEDHNYPKKVRGRYKYWYECRHVHSCQFWIGRR